MITDERKAEKLQCRICKKWYLRLGMHVSRTHGIDVREYKLEYGYLLSIGLEPAWYRTLRSKRCRENNGIEHFGDKLKFGGNLGGSGTKSVEARENIGKEAKASNRCRRGRLKLGYSRTKETKRRQSLASKKTISGRKRDKLGRLL